MGRNQMSDAALLRRLAELVEVFMDDSAEDPDELEELIELARLRADLFDAEESDPQGEA